VEKIGLIDSGTGNLGSFLNALDEVGAIYSIISKGEQLDDFSKVMLPGVGSAAGIIGGLKERSLFRATKNFLKEAEKGERKFLGVCLGLQILFSETEEDSSECFNIFPEKVIKFPSKEKVPHMGWNSVSERQKSELFKNVPNEESVYFVHSYFAPVTKYTTHTCQYGESEFSAAICKGGIYALQFHPEKSATFGLQIMKNWTQI